MQTVRVKFIDKSTIRVYKMVDGKPCGAGVTIKTANDFSTTERLKEHVEIAILSNWRVVVWLKGGRLK